MREGFSFLRGRGGGGGHACGFLFHFSKVTENAILGFHQSCDENKNRNHSMRKVMSLRSSAIDD